MFWFVIALILGAIVIVVYFFMLPRRLAGKALLRRRLLELDVDVSLLPDACIDEFVKLVVSSGESTKNLPRHGGYFINAFTELIDGTALNIAGCLDGRDDTKNNYAYEILRKHGVMLPRSDGQSI